MLQLASKYDAQAIETRARQVAIELTHPSVIRSKVSPQLPSVSILKIGCLVGCDDIANSAWEVVIEELRQKEKTTGEIIQLAELLENRKFMGDAYYESMLQGHSSWTEEQGLTQRQIQTLFRGSFYSLQIFDRIVSNWIRRLRQQPHGCPERPCKYPFLQMLFERCAADSVGSCDLEGRLRVAMELVHTECRQQVAGYGRNSHTITYQSHGCHQLYLESASSLYNSIQAARADIFLPRDSDLVKDLLESLESPAPSLPASPT